MQRVVSVLEAVDQLWRKVLENDGSDHEEKRRFRAAKDSSSDPKSKAKKQPPTNKAPPSLQIN
jgi:hypothetical protein